MGATSLPRDWCDQPQMCVELSSCVPQLCRHRQIETQRRIVCLCDHPRQPMDCWHHRDCSPSPSVLYSSSLPLLIASCSRILQKLSHNTPIRIHITNKNSTFISHNGCRRLLCTYRSMYPHTICRLTSATRSKVSSRPSAAASWPLSTPLAPSSWVSDFLQLLVSGLFH